ncbi:hypothetical protein ACOZ38_20150 [Sphaerisporangium viridialbum]|uniref:hypothetical protein n=1 Tax=Sphaerisporangium viridialbum TaxID=46189 RepID=UPI003C74D0B1
MTSRQDKEYDLTDFDADNYWIETHRATAATYYFPSLADKSARSAQLGVHQPRHSTLQHLAQAGRTGPELQAKRGVSPHKPKTHIGMILKG